MEKFIGIEVYETYLKNKYKEKLEENSYDYKDVRVVVYNSLLEILYKLKTGLKDGDKDLLVKTYINDVLKLKESYLLYKEIGIHTKESCDAVDYINDSLIYFNKLYVEVGNDVIVYVNTQTNEPVYVGYQSKKDYESNEKYKGYKLELHNNGK